MARVWTAQQKKTASDKAKARIAAFKSEYGALPSQFPENAPLNGAAAIEALAEIEAGERAEISGITEFTRGVQASVSLPTTHEEIARQSEVISYPLMVCYLIAGELARLEAIFGMGKTATSWTDPKTGTLWSVGPSENGVAIYETPNWFQVTQAEQLLASSRQTLAQAVTTRRSLEKEPDHIRETPGWKEAHTHWGTQEREITANILEYEASISQKREITHTITREMLDAAWGVL